MKTNNWIEYLEQKMKSSKLKGVESIDGKYKFLRTYYFQDSYLIVEFFDSQTINKIEIGTDLNGKFNGYKIILDKRLPNVIRVKQKLFEIDENENYILTYDKKNVEIFDSFLSNIFTNGWKVEIKSFKGIEYLIIIEINNLKYRIELKSGAEQDIPMPMDTLVRKFCIFWYNLKLNEKNRNTQVLKVNP